jgi:hypothetical protein
MAESGYLATKGLIHCYDCFAPQIRRRKIAPLITLTG